MVTSPAPCATTQPLQAGDFIHLLQSGVQPVIQFNQAIEVYRDYAQCGMRARVVQLTFVDEREGLATLSLDYGEFDAFNLPLESAKYFYKTMRGNDRMWWLRSTVYRWLIAERPAFTARQVGFYNPVGSLFISTSGVLPFDLVKDDRTPLYDAYLRSETTVSYLNWLEDRVLAFTSAGCSSL